MNKFGLPQRAMDEMHAIFAKHGKVKKVVLYGSRAMGNYKNGSDIDLTMYGSALTFDDLNNIAGELEESSIPYLVDLSIFDVLDHAKLKDHIKRHGRVFYDRYAEWKTVKLGDVCELAYGKALDKSMRTEDDKFPAYGANGVKTYAVEPLHEKPSIIIGRKGSAGELNFVKEPFWALDVTYYVKHDESLIELEFLFYLLTLQNLPSLARGVKPGINRNDVYSISVPLPPLAEQQRIVAKLDAAFAEIDTAIEITRQREDTLKSLKSSILLGELENKDS